MPSNLSRAQRNFLQAMGVCVKELLYKASRDGCSPVAFHQKCDNQGPTLVLLHNTAGYVFGGCAFQSWTSGTAGADADVSDAKAFLFRLEDKGVASPAKLPASAPDTAIHCSSTLGPRFGAGPDLLVFGNKTHTLVDGSHFPLDGSCAVGKSYDAIGLNAAAFMGLDFKMVEVQVFKIEEYHGQIQQALMEKPWRPPPKESLKELRQWVLHYQPVEEAKAERSNLLLVGPVGSGKSSFFNTIYSIFCGYVASKACSGSAEHSLSTKLRVYQVKDPVTRLPLNFRLVDTMGLEEGHGIHPGDVAAALNGNVPDGYQFNPSNPINPNTGGYRKDPSISDIVHSILFVIDSLSLGVFPEKILSKIRDIRQIANNLDIPQAVLLTKVDKLCALVEEDVGDTFRSPAVEEAVEQAAKLVGLPRARVLPVKNYESEADLDPEVDRLALTALRTALRSADNFLDNRLDALDVSAPGQAGARP